MGDGSGVRDGGFKISTHGFTEQENLFLVNLIKEKYGIKATLQKDGNKKCIYVWKHSTVRMKALVLPLFQESCMYKWRHVKQ
jgi:hypothetical protein